MPSQDDVPGNAFESSCCARPRVSSSADVHSNAASRRRPHSCQSIGLTPAGIGMAKPCEAAAGKVGDVLLDTAPSTVSMRRRFSGVEGPWNGARRKDGPANCLYDMPDDPSPGTLGYKNTTGDAERFTAAATSASTSFSPLTRISLPSDMNGGSTPGGVSPARTALWKRPSR